MKFALIAIAAAVLLFGCLGLFDQKKPNSQTSTAWIPPNSQKTGIPIASAKIIEISDSFNAYAPSISNDGTKMAFRTDKNTIGVYDKTSGKLVEINKVPVRGYNREFELDSFKPKITGEGRAVVFLMQNKPPTYNHVTAEIFASSSDGLISQRITQAPAMFDQMAKSLGVEEANLLTIAVDDLGVKFAFLVSVEKNGQEIGKIIATLEGKSIVPLTGVNEFSYLGEPVTTWDGKYIVFPADNALYYARPDASKEKIDLGGKATSTSVADSKAAVRIEGQGSTPSGIYLVDLDKKSVEKVVDEANGKTYEVALSNNGKRIYFTADFTGEKELYVVESNGANLRQVTQAKGPIEGIEASKDGNTVSFVSTKNGAKAYLAEVS